jgi:hypothetical protein
MPFDQRAGYPECEIHRPAAVVPDEIERRQRHCPALQWRAARRDGDVIDVMAGTLRQRAVLSPPGHASVDQPGIAREARIRAETQPFGDPRPESFDQHIRLLHDGHHNLDRLRGLEIERYRTAAPRHEVEFGIKRQPNIRGRDPIDTQDVRPHIGQHHSAEWARPDASQLQDLHTREGTAHSCGLMQPT